VGCGTGVPTLELARLTDGQIIALDICQSHLDELRHRARQAGLADRIETIHGSLFDIDFPAGSFDIIWSEGSIHIIGFERGSTQWRHMISPGGFLVVHDMIWLQPDPPQEILDYWQARNPDMTTISDYLGRIPRCGYRLIGHFCLPDDVWWHDYYGPLETRIAELRPTYKNHPKVLEALGREHVEIELYKRYYTWYGSAFFATQKA
jgi:SAM-dependent methyltransferase